MNIAINNFADLPEGVSVVRDPKGLKHFRDSSCSAVIWQREAPSYVTQWLEALAPNVLPKIRAVLPASGVAEAVRHTCDFAGMPDGAHRDWLIGDIAALAHQFADLMQAAHLRLRLEAVTTNACRKFHRDAITGRLICTYRGSGTEFGTSQGDHDPTNVFAAATCAPILLRGSLWPEEPPSGLLHRSPPIEGSGETRLVLVLDPICDPEDDV